MLNNEEAYTGSSVNFYLLLHAASELWFFLLAPPAISFDPFSESIYRIPYHFPVFNFINWPILCGVIRCGVVAYSIWKSLKICCLLIYKGDIKGILAAVKFRKDQCLRCWQENPTRKFNLTSTNTGLCSLMAISRAVWIAL